MAIGYLAGVPLVGFRLVGWAQTAGVQPYQRIFEVRDGDADAVLRKAKGGGAKGGPIDLVLGSNDDPETYKKLFVVSTQPGSRPGRKAILVSDRRIELQRKQIIRSYNLRRRTGETRLVGEGRIETRPLVFDVAYKPWTLKDGRPWTTKEILDDVLEALFDGDPPEILSNLRSSYQIQDFELHHRGDTALARVLSFFGDLTIRITPDGKPVVYDKRDKGELAMIKRAGPPLTNTGYSALSDKSFWRPEKIVVLFERECELRFDAEPTSGGTSTTPRDGTSAVEPRVIENVISNPDREPLQVGSRRVGPTTWLTFPEWFGALPTSNYPTPASAPEDLSDKVLRKHWAGTFTFLNHLYGLDQAGNRVPVWLARIRAARRHWRQAYRISQEWMERIASVRAYRAAVLDEETGTRAPAAAYFDYLVKGSQHGIAKRRSEYHRMGWRVVGYAERLEDAELAPASVTVIDEDNGIIDIHLQKDPAGEAEEMIPGSCDEQEMPSHDFRESHAAWGIVELDAGHQVAVVLTCVQGSPNSEKRYHREEVTPQEAGKALGLDVGPCRGAELTLVVTAGLLTARFAWSDDQAAEIEDAFISGGAMPRELLTNREQVEAMARATAARAYSAWIDRVEGSFAVSYQRKLHPAGSITSVETIIEPKRGTVLSFVTLAPELEPLDWEAMIPDGIYRTIARIAQP